MDARIYIGIVHARYTDVRYTWLDVSNAQFASWAVQSGRGENVQRLASCSFEA